MAEFVEVRTLIEGHEAAADLAHGILLSGLATSIDIAEVPHPSAAGATAWQLTLVTTEQQVPALERHVRRTGGDRPIDRVPIAHHFDGYPDWLTGDDR
ncbi:hypothetical protein [Nonomuraea sp. NPDC049309]|uniref:hypothetical protein n=1 Tax=Nonomuraea sp. NPDC049309 TaxID=3364350 RepID=UPI00372383B3